MDTVIKTRKDGAAIAVKEQPWLSLQKTSLASLECLDMPLVHQVVLSADFQCPKCQARIDDMVSRMNEIESVVVNVLDKTVTLTCKYPLLKKDYPTRQAGTLCKRPSQGKFALLMKLCRLSKS
uniref:HMA domain-containing protein n=1 Tax=Kalanchoe fedtschenkoi TaxID=63787 RepID=A0A7N0T5Y9_KALFE